MQHLINVFFGIADKRDSCAVVQQAEYNSREMLCTLYIRETNGKKRLMPLDNTTVSVVYRQDKISTPEYPTTICGEGQVCFTVPAAVLKNSGKTEFQLLVYNDSSLITSAIIPFQVLGSIPASDEGIPDDVEPAMISLLKDVREVLIEASDSEKARKEAEEQREQRFQEMEDYVDQITLQSIAVVNAATHYDFPSIGDENLIYKAQEERKTYQWNPITMAYETLGDGSVQDIDCIDGGSANGTTKD